MRALEECRRTQVLVDGAWQDAKWEQIDAGDIIRMFNPDGTPLLYHSDKPHLGFNYVVVDTPAIRVDPKDISDMEIRESTNA